MSRRVTQDDVARMAGVTRSVVSYVLNGNTRAVAPDTKDRVLKAIEDLGYRPNKHAQSLGSGQTNPMASKQIGIVLNNAEVFLRPYYAEILSGIHAKAHEEGYHIRFIRFFDELRDPLLFNSLVHGEEVCGVILLALDQSIQGDEDHHLIDLILERIPNSVCVEWQREGLSSVTFNRMEASLTATRHLLAQGRRNLVYIGESDERITGFRQAMIEAGTTNVAELVLAGANDMASGMERAATILAAHPGTDAIMAGSDEVAMGILSYLHQRDIDVPGQIMIASIDNLEMAAFTSPPLTTINVQKANMGRQAVQLIINQDRMADSQPVTMLLPSSLVVRESSRTP